MPTLRPLRILLAAAMIAPAAARAAEAVLVHDIAAPHPRYTQFTRFAAEAARLTQGTLAVALNPGGKVLYPGQASLDRKSTRLNSSHT